MKLDTIKLYQRFGKSENGSISILGAGTMLLMVLIIGLAIDSSRLVQSSDKLKALNDMAAIAATQEPNISIDERKVIFERIMDYGVANNEEITGYEYDIVVEDDVFKTVLSATTRSKSELFFPSVSGEERFVTAHSEVIVGKEFVEVALVLDVSSSMTGGRLPEMKLAASAFIDILMEDPDIRNRVAISVVPYGGTVRVPDELRNMLIEPDTNEHWFGGEWNGCFRMNTDDLNEALSPGDQFNFIPSFTGFSPRNPWCPAAGDELLGLSNDRDELLAKIDHFDRLSDGTGTDIGVAWGLATLDPQWRGEFPNTDPDFPRDFAEGTRKIMVVMTDGGLTSQRFPRDSEFSGNLPYHTNQQDNSFNESFDGYRDFCNRARVANIDVYTVGFSLRNQGQVDRLQECGTTLSHNFEADLGDLESVFENLAASITSLRLSQ